MEARKTTVCLRIMWNFPVCSEQTDSGEHRQKGICPTPAETKINKCAEEQGTENVTERTRQRPARHVLLMPVWSRVHQCGLAQADKCARGGIKQDEGNQQGKKAPAQCREHQRSREYHPASQDDQPPLPDISKDSQERLDERCKDSGETHQQPDLGIGKGQVIPNERPGGLTHPKDQLIDQLREEIRQVQLPPLSGFEKFLQVAGHGHRIFRG